MAVQVSEVGVTADLTVLVTRDDQGTLEEGALDAVGGVEGVHDVEAIDVTGVRPRLNDLAVEVTVDLRVAVDHGLADVDGAVREALEDGFGVTVENLALRTEA